MYTLGVDVGSVSTNMVLVVIAEGSLKSIISGPGASDGAVQAGFAMQGKNMTDR